MKVNKSITIYDIAKATQLSPSSISKIINQKGSYSEATKAKVFSAIEELGYIPNTKARQLSEGTTNIIGVDFYSRNNRNSTYSNNYLVGICNKANEFHYNVMLYNNAPSRGGNIPETIHDFDGMIFPNTDSTLYDYFNFLNRHRKPFVYTGNRLPFDYVHRNVYGGYLDYIQEVLNIFYKKGRRHILLFPQTSYIDFMFYQKAMIQARIEEFIREHDLDSTFCSLGAYAEPGSKDLLDAIDAGLAKNTPADALFFNSVPASITVYNHIQQLGLRIPEDIAIISTAHSPTEGQEFSPPLSTIFVHAYDMGQRAVEILLHQIDPEKFPELPAEIPFSFIERRSC